MSIKLDLHVHSQSNGKTYIDAKQLKEAINQNNIDGVAITNFFDISHALWFKEKLKECIIIVGQEIWTKEGHIVGLGLKKKISDRLSAAETIALIHEQKGIAVAVHPFLHLGVGKNTLLLPVDAIEVYNGVLGKFGIRKNYLANKIAIRRDICPLASTDTTNPKFLGYSYTEVMTDDSNLVLEAICSKRVRLYKRALPIPFAFIIKSLFYFRNFVTCSTHAVPCFICGKSMSVRMLERKYKCLDCGKIESSRIICCNNHYICEECFFARVKDDDYQAKYKDSLALQEITREGAAY